MAVFDTQIYTDDKTALRNAIAREHQKEVALEALAKQRTQVLQPQLQQQQATGMSLGNGK